MKSSDYALGEASSNHITNTQVSGKKFHDGFQRQFSYLRLSITDVCNYRCNYCLPEGYQCDEQYDNLTLEEIQTLAQVFAQHGTRKIRITGGEPVIRKDLADIIRVVKSTPGIEDVALTTNGYKLEDKVESWFDAGLDGLNLSIDSLDPRVFQTITGHNRLKDILRGLDKAICLGFKRIKVNAVLLKSYNLQEFDTFLHWLQHMPISLRFIELMQTGDNGDYFRQNHVSGETIKQRLLAQGWQLKKKGPLAGPAQEFEHPDYLGSMGLIMPYSKDFCNSCNRLRISSTGKLHTCLFGDGGYDLRSLIRNNHQADIAHEIQQQLLDKKASHYLQQGYSGSTRHLAMLGG